MTDQQFKQLLTELHAIAMALHNISEALQDPMPWHVIVDNIEHAGAQDD
jgi:hypothetical protein